MREHHKMPATRKQGGWSQTMCVRVSLCSCKPPGLTCGSSGPMRGHRELLKEVAGLTSTRRSTSAGTSAATQQQTTQRSNNKLVLKRCRVCGSRD